MDGWWVRPLYLSALHIISRSLHIFVIAFPLVLYLSSSDLELASYQLNESRDNVPGKHEICFKCSRIRKWVLM